MPDTVPTLDSPSVHPTYVRMLCMALQRHGVDVDGMLRDVDMPPWQVLAKTDAYLDQRTINRLIGASVRASGRPWLGIEVGAGVPISAHGPLGYAAVASADLRQALETVTRFGVLRNATLRYRLGQEAQGSVVTLVERVDLGEARSFVMGMLFAILIRLMETVVGQPLQGLAIDLPFAEPPWRSEIEKVCNGTLRFEALQLALHVDAATLALPCITADAQAYAQACLACEQQLAQAADTSLAQRVRELLQACEGHYPALAEVAAYFSLSERTLMRHLKHEGCNYQALLDGARQQRTLWYLRQTRHTVEEIAQRMGYEDTSNFSRTFRRWFGITPGEARRGAEPVATTQTGTISKSALA